VNRSELARLFGDLDGGGIGTGPRTWTGGDDGQTRKARFCAAHHRHYSVDVEECPYCREQRQEARGQAIAVRIRAQMRRLRATPGLCNACFAKLLGIQTRFCSKSCRTALRDEQRREAGTR
jgi:hypothetical protein